MTLASRSVAFSSSSGGGASAVSAAFSFGFAVAALERQPDLKTGLGIPRGETVHAVIALGWPAERYQRLSGRKRALIRFAE
jgi:hypothetical protein